MNPNATELLATVLFGLAVLHTFCVNRFAHWAQQFPPGSVHKNLLHFLAETEVVFGLWAATLFLGIGALKGAFHDAVVVLFLGIALVFTVLLLKFRSFREPVAIVFGSVLALTGTVGAVWLKEGFFIAPAS